MLQVRPRLVSPGDMLWCTAGATDLIFLPRKVPRQNGAPEVAMCAKAATIKKTRLRGRRKQIRTFVPKLICFTGLKNVLRSTYVASRATMLGNM